jgi:hypothetical protein
MRVGSNGTRGTKKERDGVCVGEREREREQGARRLTRLLHSRKDPRRGWGNYGVQTSHGACLDMVSHAHAQPFKRPSPELKPPHTPLSFFKSKRQ